MKKSHLLLLLFGLFIVGCAKDAEVTTLAPSNDTPTVEIIPTGDIETDMIGEVNAIRARGCTCGSKTMPPVNPLNWNNLLEEAAIRHATDMATHNYFDHQGQDGSSFSDRISDTGYPWQAIGENIAFGYTSVNAVVEAWLNSEGHCQNMMNPNFTEMGVAAVSNYWVQDFGKSNQ